MSINFPVFKEIIRRVRADISSYLPETDPTIFGSFVRALAESIGGRILDLYLLLEQIVKQLFPQTASDEFLLRWGEYEDLTRNLATISSGLITVTGTLSSVIPNATSIKTTDGREYTTKAELTMADILVNITSITRVGTTATVLTASDHSMATGQNVTIAGAIETDFNGSFQITVTDTNQFEYTVSNSPSSPATGTITAAYTGGSVEIESDLTGQAQNIESGGQLDLVTPISGINVTSYVQFSEVGGGTDEETDRNYLSRILNARANPVANFNVGAISKVAFSVPGVTRVKVKRITPAIGSVTILFVRDNDDNLIPSVGEIADVKTQIDAIAPAITLLDNIHVLAPTPVSTDFVFGSITPDTASMRVSIEANLTAYFQDRVDFETSLTPDSYRSAIIDSLDTETGLILESFVLTSPTTIVPVGTDEIGILGSVIFP